MTPGIQFRVQGATYQVSAEDVVERLKGIEPEQLQAHSVTVGGVEYPVKQAFAAVTGIDRLDFVTTHARSVFRRLGFEVRRTQTPSRDAVRPALSAPVPAGSAVGSFKERRLPKEADPMTFAVTLSPTYLRSGFFNARVEFDRWLADKNCEIEIELGDSKRTLRGRIDRGAQPNGTARVFGGAALRDYLQSKYRVGDRFVLTIFSPAAIRVS